MAYLKIRYKKPAGSVSELLEFPVNKSIIDKNIVEDNIFAMQVAGFAQLYRNSDYLKEEYNYDSIIKALSDLDLSYEKEQFLKLVKMTKSLKENK